jgi:hypothetical protein
MSLDESGRSDRPKRKVAIRRDGNDFVAAFQPEDFIALRNDSATALRKVCHFLGWVVVSDVIADPKDPATW